MANLYGYVTAKNYLIFFSSLWGNFGVYAQQESFNQIFSKPELKVETLLDDDEFLNEVKASNQKIIDL